MYACRSSRRTRKSSLQTPGQAESGSIANQVRKWVLPRANWYGGSGATRSTLSENIDMRRGQDPRVAYIYQFIHQEHPRFSYRDRDGKPHPNDHRHVYGTDGKTKSRTVV